MLHATFDFLLHLSQHLKAFVSEYGVLSYAILSLILFCETGLVIAPFLPGDTLLLAAGSLAASGALNIHYLIPIFTVAVLLGDNVNYWMGRTVGKRLFQHDQSKFFKKRYLLKTEHFYQKYGGKTIVIARFVPIVRTFSPFVAGIAKMRYRRFLSFSLLGAVLWVGGLSYLSYAFGNIPVLRGHLFVVLLIVIALSLIPAVLEWIKIKRQAKH